MLVGVSKAKNALSVLVVALVIILYLFFNSAIFETDDLEWTGLNYLDGEHLDTYIDFEPVNVWRFDTRELVETLIEHPWIESAKVSWRWPNRIIVRVQECNPVAQLPTAGGWMLMDKEGNLLPPTQGAVYSLPIVTNLDLDSSEQLKATARLMSIIPPVLAESISEWNVNTRSFISCSGTEIMMGQAVDLEEKFVLLEQILDDLAQKGEQARKIDLRVPRSPVVSIF